MKNNFKVVCLECGSENTNIVEEYDYNYDDELCAIGDYCLKCSDCGNSE